MEVIGEFIPDPAACPDAAVFSGGPVPAAVSVPAWSEAVDGALALLQGLDTTAVAEAAFFGLMDASDFAGRVEDLSRTLECLQLVAAAAVERSRDHESPTDPAAIGSGGEANAGWLTGWHSAGSGPPGHTAVPAGQTVGPAGAAGLAVTADDGFRNTTEFLRARLRISAAEARRRLSLAAVVLPGAGIAGQLTPPMHQELAAALAAGTVASRAATIITLSLDRVRHTCPPESSARMEHALTLTAVENDHDFLTRIARRWTDALDQDGAEPSEEELRQLQGAFIRQPRRGLHHLEIFATGDQFEHLLTVMNTATNPRAHSAAVHPATANQADADGAAAAAAADALDQRSQPQQRLDGLVGACKAALASGALPAAGGLRPQVLVTIDYRDLVARLGEPGTATPDAAGAGPDTEPDGRRAPAQTGTLPFTGPVTTATARKIACDADIIPVLLGGEGRILDIGRASRVFPPHIRKALTARDRGCAFPQCTIPAPWCEAHHISYWSRGGTTSTENGTLLCSHHHHLIHKELWSIQVRIGVPWFIPPPHVDPRQVPRRNRYFRLE